MFQKHITKEELQKLPLLGFEGDITLVDNLGQIDDAMNKLYGHHLLGFDTETKPSFKKGRRNKVALLQLSTPEHAVLFRLNRVGLPHKVAAILADKDVVKVGAAIKEDIRTLQRLNRFTAASFVDLQQYVKEFNIESFALNKITAIVLKHRISKSQQLSNWENNELSHAQMRYAATDAWIGQKIYKTLKESEHLIQ